MKNRFKPSEFIANLKSKSLDNSLTIDFFGLIKVEDNSTESIEFSEDLNCSNWIEIPISIIESIDYIRTQDCKDHNHPYVLMRLQSPKDNPESKALFKLLSFNKAFRNRRYPRFNSDWHWTGYYRCRNREPWKDAWGNGPTCEDAIRDARDYYVNEVCGGHPQAGIDGDSKDCYQ